MILYKRLLCVYTFIVRKLETNRREMQTFDGRPGAEGWMITGTKQGCLYWWPQPVAAASNHNGMLHSLD